MIKPSDMDNIIKSDNTVVSEDRPVKNVGIDNKLNADDKVIFTVGKWLFAKSAGLDSERNKFGDFYLTDGNFVDYPKISTTDNEFDIKRNGGSPISVAYDYPERIPMSIRTRVLKIAQKYKDFRKVPTKD